MGRPSFTKIDLEITWEGDKPTSARWIDNEGCGGEGPEWPLEAPILRVVEEHVNHCIKSHGMKLPSPKISMCDFEIHPKTGGSLTCKLERHGDDTRHQFEL